MNKTLVSAKANFGTLPVFLTAISTILGAVMFLRFGFAVGSVGFMGTLAIIIIGHLVTIPTAMALAEIAVQGSGGVLLDAVKRAKFNLDESQAILAYVHYGKRLAENGLYVSQIPPQKIKVIISN